MFNTKHRYINSDINNLVKAAIKEKDKVFEIKKLNFIQI